MGTKQIGIGVIGGGYMGKAHATAFAAVGVAFETKLKPRLVSVAASSLKSAERYRDAFGYEHAADNWRAVVDDPDVEAVIVASPQDTHRQIAEAALNAGKHVLCEKPLGATLAECEAMVALAEANPQLINMIGFNYMRTPVTQQAINMVRAGRLGDIVSFRVDHSEDFLADPDIPGNWRTESIASGTMGDLAPHPINCALTFMGPVSEVMAVVQTVHTERPGPDGTRVAVTNDDQINMILQFENGVTGTLHTSRVSTGTKMGLRYEIVGTKGTLRFDQEEQSQLHFYDVTDAPDERGFRRILSGPQHPDYLMFNQGEGHGTGYIDQIIMQAAAFLKSIETGTPASPSFADGLAAARVCEAALKSSEARSWQTVDNS
ncbi:MAG: Gfo/Idh/MocA family oxidoreductase [Pseudomonadota bacterium]